jgi:very-short-patch-repair endonuclease
MGQIDRIIGPAAAGQLGLVTRRQLLGQGLTLRQIDRRRADGRLIDVHPGVYRMSGLPPSYKRNVLAACLATGGAASGRSAARIFRLRGFEQYHQTVEITVAGPRAPRLAGIIAHRTTRLERTEIGIIPVTMPSQTLVDLAAIEPCLAEGALNHALGRRLVRLPALVRYLSDLGPRPGSARLRELVELQTKGVRPTASWLEDRVQEFLRSLGLPEPVRQHPLRLQDGRLIWFDFAYPARRMAIEADSRLWHSTPKAQRADAERDRAAAALGWAVVRITWLDLEERPREIARWFSPQAA